MCRLLITILKHQRAFFATLPGRARWLEHREMPRPEAREPHRAYCDSRFRCVHCPGGIGRGGRGFTRARNVPCMDPTDHLRRSAGLSIDDWRIHPTQFWAIPEMYASPAEFEATQRNLALVCGQWCVQCTRERDDPAPAAKRRRTGGARPLASHIARRPAGTGDVSATRDRIAQLAWCDSRYRCIVCLPKGQTRRLSSKQCSDRGAHMPHGVSRKETVHFRPVGAAETQLSEEQLLKMKSDGMCHACEGCQ